MAAPSRRAPLALVLALLAATSGAVAAAAWTTHGIIDAVPENATAWNTQRKLVRDADGALHAIILDEAGDKGGARVTLHRSLDNGTTWTPHATVPTTNATLRPTLAAAPGGGLWVAWTEFLPEEGFHQVFTARFENGTWGPVTRLSHTAGYSGFPSLAIQEDGTRVHAAWYGLDQGFYQVFHRVRDANGTWSAPTRLSVGVPDAVNPALAVGPDDALNVVWYKQQDRHYQVWFTRWTPDGAWSAPKTLSAGPAHSMNPSVVVGADNVVHVAWDRQGVRDGTPRALWTASATAGTFSSPAGAPADVEGVAEGPRSFPSLALDADGRRVLAWTQPDGVHVALEEAGAFVGSAVLGGPGARDPNLRWQAFHQPAEPVELVFTDAGGDAPTARHARLDPSGGADAVETPGASVWVVLVAVAFGSASARRRRGSKE